MPRIPLKERIDKIEARRAEHAQSSEQLVEVNRLSEQSAAEYDGLLQLEEKIHFARVPEIDIFANENGGHEPHFVQIRQFYTESDLVVLVDRLGRTDREIWKRGAQILSVIRHQQRAGTAEEREAALGRCNVAEESLASKGPAIEEQIRRLQTELNALSHEQRAAKIDYESRQVAIQNLRKLVPRRVQERYDRERLKLQPLRNELDQTRVRIKTAKEIAEIDIKNGGLAALEKAYLALKGVCGKLSGRAADVKDLHYARWYQLVHEMTNQIPQLEVVVSELTSQLQAAEADLENILDYYVE